MKRILDNRDTLTHGSILSLYLFRNTIGEWRRCICWAKVGKEMGDKDEGTHSLFFYRLDKINCWKSFASTGNTKNTLRNIRESILN